MKNAFLRLDRWIHCFCPVTREGLGICRVFYAAFFLLLNIPVFNRIGANPPGFFTPPPLSLAAPFTGFPSANALFALDVLICVLLIFLLVGFKTRLASVALSLCWIAGNSFLYSFGKIDETTLAVITPLIMGFSGWEARFSIDAKRGASDGRVHGWALAFLALLVAFGFFSAGLPKLLAWVDFDLGTQGARGWLVNGWYGQNRRQFLAPFFMELQNAAFWEAADYVTVIFEVGFLFSLLRLVLFRAFLFMAVWFHLANALMLNISLEILIPVYFIFVPWERFSVSAVSRLSRATDRLASFSAMAALVIAFMPLYALTERIPIDRTVTGFSHAGVLFSFLSIDFKWISHITVHIAAVAGAVCIAGWPKCHATPNLALDLPAGKRIVLFDGVCNLCNSFVDFLVQRRRQDDVMFASFQSDAGERIRMAYSLSAETPSQESILLLDADRVVYEQADAILRIASSLRGPFRLLVVFWLVPRSLRNVGYRMVARWRYAVFGKRTTCRVPTPEERGLFL